MTQALLDAESAHQAQLKDQVAASEARSARETASQLQALEESYVAAPSDMPMPMPMPQHVHSASGVARPSKFSAEIQGGGGGTGPIASQKNSC